MSAAWPARLIFCLLAACTLLAGCAQPGATPAGSPKDWATDSSESPARKRARLRLELATAYYQQGQDAVALEEVRQALAHDPASASAWNLRGLIYLGQSEWTPARESFERAVALAPHDADLAHNFGWMLCQQPQLRMAEAEAQFRGALAHASTVQAAKTWVALGLCQQRAARLDEAEASLRQALQIDPSQPRALWPLVQLLASQGRWEPAQEALLQLHAIEKPSADSLWLAIRIARKLDNAQLFRDAAVQLRQEFGRSRQAQALDKGWFDE